MMKVWLCIISGILLFLPFLFAGGDFPLGFLSYFALVPLFFVLESTSFKRGFLFGLLTGFIFFSGLLHWLLFLNAEESSFPLLLTGVFVLVVYQTLYVALFSLTYSYFRKRLGNFAYLFAPFLWSSLEYIRGLTSLGFPWGSLAYTQTRYIHLIQFASITGTPGITCWIVSINILIFLLLKNRKKRLIFIIVIFILFLLPWLHGRIRLDKEFKGSIRVALIQINLDPDRIWGSDYKDEIKEVLEKMIQEAAASEPDLIVLPETALPSYLRFRYDYEYFFRTLLREFNIPILTGATRYDYRESKYYNTAYLFSFREKEHYDKLHLVPFGERLPYDDVFTFLQKINWGQGNYSPGKEYKVFSNEKFPFSVLICFESIFSSLSRKFVNEGAEVLFNITNDEWFGRTSGPFQHAEMVIFRAIENGVPVGRCGNTGVTMLIDPYGRTTKRTEIFTREVVVGNLHLLNERTFYTRFGDGFAYIAVIISLIGLLYPLFRKK